MDTPRLLAPLAQLHAESRSYLLANLNQRLIARTTLAKVISSMKASDLAKPALTSYEGEVLSQQYTYKELLSQIRRLAFWFAKVKGVESGERVVVLSSNAPQTYVAHLALMSMGAVTVPVSNVESPAVLDFIIKKVEPCLVVTGRDVSPELTLIEECLTCSLPTLPILPTPSDAEFIWPEEDVQPDDPAVILFTSGTTSVPKGVCLSHYNLLVNAEGLCRAHNLVENSVHMCILPLFHANAFGFSMIASLYAANHVVLCAGLPGMDVWSILREHRVNVISLVPEIIRVLSICPPPRDSLPDMRYVVSAAAPLSKAVARTFMANTGIEIHQGYGLSECVNFAATVPWDVSEPALEAACSHWQVPSIGPEVFGCEIDIVRTDGASVDEEEEGEIVVRGHTLMLGYWDEQDATKVALGDGYLRTGDLGFFARIDGRRYNFVTGRKKEIIVRYGENLSPLVIEAQLNVLRELGHFAVTGFANEMAGEEIGLYLHFERTPATEQKVMECVSACSDRYKPRVILFAREPVPVTPTGKVKRSLLAERFGAYKKRMCGNDPHVDVIEYIQ